MNNGSLGVVGALIVSLEVASMSVTAFAQWSGPTPPGGEPSTNDITQGMQELTGVPIAQPPVGVQRPCKCCGLKVEAKYITTSYPELREEDLLLAYVVYWQTRIRWKTERIRKDEDRTWWGADHTMLCRYAPVGDWSAIPANAIPPLTFVTGNFAASPKVDGRCYMPTIPLKRMTVNDSYATTCIVPAGAEVAPSSIPKLVWPNIQPPAGHGLTYVPGHGGKNDREGYYTGDLLGFTPAYRSLVKIHVKYYVQVNYSRWAMICTAGHDQSLTCDGTGGLGQLQPTPPPPPPPKNYAGEYFKQQPCPPPDEHDRGGWDEDSSYG